VAVGFSHVFGAGRKGNAAFLSELGEEYGFSVKLIDPVKVKGETVSSSKIREFISAGDIEKANLFLGRSFRVSGIVKIGEGEGAALGFPTANIELPRERIKPASGVYAGSCSLGEESYPAVLYTGRKPTFKKTLEKPSIEVHIIGFSGNIRGRKISFDFARRLRPDIKFKSARELKKKIAADIKSAAILQE
jgi:riboflavin kinase / FMN adenylyltransferase